MKFVSCRLKILSDATVHCQGLKQITVITIFQNTQKHYSSSDDDKIIQKRFSGLRVVFKDIHLSL